jgi:hypothetical protein
MELALLAVRRLGSRDGGGLTLSRECVSADWDGVITCPFHKARVCSGPKDMSLPVCPLPLAGHKVQG